ncbi:hypothetical protein ABZT49_22300 [Methylobacterium sp. EM32]|uniref:hypothetical protein n=1 Tax=Methylobacterium sp. EM32 TaxID=3163481 RepID=UPI0033AB74CA
MPRLPTIGPITLLASVGAALAGPAAALDPSGAPRPGGTGPAALQEPTAFRARTLTASDRLAVGTGCVSSDGAYATDGTLSWQPSCLGVFAAPGQDIAVYPTRGTPRGPDGKAMADSTTTLLVQARGDGAVAKGANGIFVNFETVGGPESKARLDTTNATGQLISVRQRPGPNGEKPPSTWGHNIDFHIAPGSGGVQSWGVEYDMNNFNQDCAPSSTCLSAAMFFNGISGHPNTAWLYSGGGSTNTYAGTVTVAKNTVTWVSGQKFVPAIYRIKLGETLYRAHFVSPTQLAGDVAIPDAPGPVAYAAQNAMVHNGIYFQGENNVSDTDLLTATSAYNAINVAGHHHVGLNTSADSTRFALLASTGQGLCLDTFDGCLSHAGGGLQYAQNGTVALRVEPGRTTTRGVINSPLSTPASSSAPCMAGDWAHDAAFVYTCVATNTWKRAALSSW